MQKQLSLCQNTKPLFLFKRKVTAYGKVPVFQKKKKKPTVKQ